jgi:glycosyltransferase involved in cell wall biosynthesis
MTIGRIVYLWDADYPWDVRTEKTCLALTDAGHDVHIVARNRKWSPLVERLPEGTVHRMGPWRWAGRRIDGALGFPAFFNPRWRAVLDRTIRSVNANVIVVRDVPLCPTAIAMGRRHRIPVVLDMAENYPAMMRAIWETGRQQPVDAIVRNPGLVQRVERWCVHRVDHIVVVVEESAARVERLGVPASRITVVSNTPSVKRTAESAPAEHRPPRTDGALDLVYMGNIEVVRGLLESIEAVAQLRSRGHRVRLRLIGRGRDDAAVRARAASLGLDGDAVQFLGFIASHQEALGIVAAADVGLMPHRKCESWDTTIPNKLFDYMAAGLPVVSSNAAPCERILTETGAGVVFQSENVDSLATALLAMFDPARRSKLGSAGQRAVAAKYNWEHDSQIFVQTVEANTTRRS